MCMRHVVPKQCGYPFVGNPSSAELQSHCCLHMLSPCHVIKANTLSDVIAEAAESAD